MSLYFIVILLIILLLYHELVYLWTYVYFTVHYPVMEFKQNNNNYNVKCMQ